MHPILYKCSFFTIYTYGVFVAFAFVVASVFLSIEAKRRHFDENVLYNLSILLLVSGIIFARLFYVSLNWDFFKDNLAEIVMLAHGGLVWFGGLIGACVCGFVFIKINKLPLWETFDLLAPMAALVQSIGRMGCFFNGCCYGKAVGAWGVYFPVHGRLLFPSQILDSLTLLSIFVYLRWLQPRSRKGEIFCLYLILASVQRFLMEFIRGDERTFYFHLSIFQWISLGLFFIGLFLYGGLLWKKKSV